MDNSCPATPLVLNEADSKSPLRITTSSPESEGKSPSRDSPDSHCVICLGRLKNKSFTDSCLHQFCFQCLLQWSKVKAECPLCKQPFKSIIHNVRSNLDYDQYHVEVTEQRCVLTDLMHSFNFDFIQVDHRFRYRSTMTRDYFRELAESLLTRNSLMNNDYYQIPPMMPVGSSTPNLRMSNRLLSSGRHRGTTEFRRNIYSRDLWVQDLQDISGRYRECTPQFYRDNPAQVHRIVPWLNREVNVLLNDSESQVAYILTRIISYLSQHPIRSREFKELVEPYFGPRTDHFIHELYTFAHSVYDIAGFDQHAVYGPNPNYATEVQEISSSSNEDDSDVEVLETVNSKGEKRRKSSKQDFKGVLFKRVKQHQSSNEPVAGPSGIHSKVSTEPLQISESDQDDIQVLDYVKPDPEVVVLSSDDDGATRRAHPSTYPCKTELVEVLSDSNDKSIRLRLSASDDCMSSSDKDKSDHKSRKGKCRSNGQGLKGKQKQKYMKSRKTNVESKRSSTASSSSLWSSSSDWSSESVPSPESKTHHKSKRKKNKGGRKKVSSYKTNSPNNRHRKSGTNGVSRSSSFSSDQEESLAEVKKRVKSCVIVPGSRGRDFVVKKKDRKAGRNPPYPTSYWSMMSKPEKERYRRWWEEDRPGKEGWTEDQTAKYSTVSGSSDFES